MNVDEIKAELKARGMTQQQLADQLKVSYSNIRQIMCGAIRLTPQLAAHIDLLFGRRREQVIVYTIDLPEARCRDYIPDWDTLPPAQQEVALKSILRAAADRLIAIGATISPEELKSLGLDHRDAADDVPGSPT